VEISCAFAPSMATPEHVVLAERLGYRRAWMFDSPALYPDVWMVLALAAERTTTIGLGPGVLVPSLRHPMVDAAAIAALVDLAPGRVAVAVGAGYSGRKVLGQRPMRWADVAARVRAIQGLLRGDEVRWEGRTLRMLHGAGFGAARPIDVPWLVGASGPKGLAVANELGAGVFSAGVAQPTTAPWHALLTNGTVLDEGEEPTSARALAAAGPGLATMLHGVYEFGGAEAVDGLPGGRAWREAVEQTPAEARHLAVHEGHLVALNDRDQLAIGELAPLMASFGVSGDAKSVREKVAAFAERGVTEVAYQPSGPDIPRELRAFIDAVE
jgi:5,10-methylenetetrahydromethanopterin reductase